MAVIRVMCSEVLCGGENSWEVHQRTVTSYHQLKQSLKCVWTLITANVLDFVSNVLCFYLKSLVSILTLFYSALGHVFMNESTLIDVLCIIKMDPIKM